MTTGLPAHHIRIFSSHSWWHTHRRDELHSIMQPWLRGVDFEDYSISKRHPIDTDTDPQLAAQLRDRIQLMDALLIMAGMWANNSPWMQFEIDMAFAFRVPIIPILDFGQQRIPRIPTRLASCEPVRWRGQSIREAILRFLSPERQNAIATQVRRRAIIAAALHNSPPLPMPIVPAQSPSRTWPTSGNAFTEPARPYDPATLQRIIDRLGRGR